VNVLAPIIQWKWMGEELVGCHSAPPSGAGPPSPPEDEPLELDADPLELEPELEPEPDPLELPELDFDMPPELPEPELDEPTVPELDAPASCAPPSKFVFGAALEDPQAAHQARTAGASSQSTLLVAMPQS
jgi:hypothetical protein